MTLQTAPMTQREQGVWVRLSSFPACNVFVSDQEVSLAIWRDSGKRRGYQVRDYTQTAKNIAIGKRAGTYPKHEGDIQTIRR